MKKISLIISVLLIIFYILPTLAAENLKDAFKNPLARTLEPTQIKTDAIISPENVVGDTINAILTLLGVIFISLMVYAGGLWMTARGNEQQAEKAKNLITEAIIGLVIVVAAYAISYFVIKNIGSGNIKNLEDKSIPQEQNQ